MENEESNICSMKANIQQEEQKLEQSNIENTAKLSEASAKLDSLESEFDRESQAYTSKLDKIMLTIKDKDERIKELESILNKLIDQRHVLEWERNQLVETIDSVSKKHATGIDKARDLKERFERKLLVNQENSDSLEAEKQVLCLKQQNLVSALSSFDCEIEGFGKLAQE